MKVFCVTKSFVVRFVIFYSAIAILLLAFANDLLYEILSLLIVEVIFNYSLSNKIIIEKYKAKNKYKDKFNEDYFNLYWEISKNRIGLFLNVILVLIFLSSRWSLGLSNNVDFANLTILLVSFIKWFLDHFVLTLVLLVPTVFLLAIFIDRTQNRYLEKIISIKSNKYKRYSRKEKRILRKIK